MIDVIYPILELVNDVPVDRNGSYAILDAIARMMDRIGVVGWKAVIVIVLLMWHGRISTWFKRDKDE